MENNSWDTFRESFGLATTSSSAKKTAKAQAPKRSTVTPKRRQSQISNSQFLKQSLNISVTKSNYPVQNELPKYADEVSNGETKVKSELTEEDWMWLDGDECINELLTVTSQYDIPTEAKVTSLSTTASPIIVLEDFDNEVPINDDYKDSQEYACTNTTRKRSSSELNVENNFQEPERKQFRLEESESGNSSNALPEHMNSLSLNTTELEVAKQPTYQTELDQPSSSKSYVEQEYQEQCSRDLYPKPFFPEHLYFGKIEMHKEQMKSDLKLIKNMKLQKQMCPSNTEVMRTMGPSIGVPEPADYRSTGELFYNLLNAAASGDDTDVNLYKEITHALFIKKPLFPCDIYRSVSTLVTFCENLLIQATSDLFSPSTDNRQDYRSITSHKWWMDHSLHDTEPWCLNEFHPLLRRSLALLVEACKSHKEIVMIVLESALTKETCVPVSGNSQDSAVNTNSEFSTNDDMSSISQTVSTEPDDIISDAKFHPESTSQRIEYTPPVTERTLKLVALLGRFIDLTDGHPKAPLAEGNVCASLDLLAALASKKSFVKSSGMCMAWILCCASRLKMTPNILIRLAKTAYAITVNIPVGTGYFCLRSSNLNQIVPCFVTRFCLMVQEILAENKAVVDETDILLGKTAEFFFLETDLHPEGEPAPKDYSKQLLLAMLNWMCASHSVPSHCAPWYVPIYKRKSICQCFKLFFKTVMKSVFSWFYLNNYKIEGSGEMELKALHILYQVKAKAQEEFSEIAGDLYLDCYQFAKMLLRENRSRMNSTDIEFAESVQQTELSSAYNPVLETFEDVVGPNFAPPAVPIWAGPYTRMHTISSMTLLDFIELSDVVP